MCAARIRLDKVLRLRYIPQIMRVGISQAGQVDARIEGALNHFKAQIIVERAQHADESVRLLVDMRGHGDAAEARNERRSLLHRNPARYDEQIFLLSDNFVVFIHYELPAENFRFVFHAKARFLDIRLQFFEPFVLFKQAEDVDILACRQLHGGQNNQPVFPPHRHRRGAVFARVMVGERDGVQSLDERHVDDIIRRAVLIPAGAQARMDMKVVI